MNRGFPAWRGWLRAALLTAVFSASGAGAQLSLESGYFLDSPESARYAVIIVGPSVGADNIAQFRQWGYSLHDILIRDYGYSAATITLLHDPDAAGANPGDSRK